MIATGGLSGGISVHVSGGSFWAGVRQGVISSGLNHAMHMGASKPPKRTLIFNGKELIIFENGEIIARYPAVSGRMLENGSFDYSAERQKVHDVGPIPEGEYSVNMNNTQKWSKLSLLQKTYALIRRGEFPGGTTAWGSERVDINPSNVNPFDIRLRSGFTIHGGSFPGSAGCIDLTIFDAKFFNTIRNSGVIRLTVKY